GVGVGVGPTPPEEITAPSIAKVVIGRPPGVLAPSALRCSGCDPSGAERLIATVQVYSVAPSGIGLTSLTETTTARTLVQSRPGGRPLGERTNDVAGLPMAGLAAHDTSGVKGSTLMSFCVPATL